MKRIAMTAAACLAVSGLSIPAVAATGAGQPSENASCVGQERATRNSAGGDRDKGGFGNAQSEKAREEGAYGQFLQEWKAACGEEPEEPADETAPTVDGAVVGAGELTLAFSEAATIPAGGEIALNLDEDAEADVTLTEGEDFTVLENGTDSPVLQITEAGRRLIAGFGGVDAGDEIVSLDAADAAGNEVDSTSLPEVITAP